MDLKEKPKLERLFEPIKIGSLELKNRIVMAPMGTKFATADGYVTERQIEYYRERARGGAGLIIVEVTAVHPTGLAIPCQICLHNDSFIPQLKKLVGAIKEEGAKAAIQIHHAGRQTLLDKQPVAPSPIPCKLLGVTPKELTIAEIEELIEAFVSAAIRAQKAGFDAVELHGAHGYLICQFFSPLTNKRNDEYGGSLEGRMKFALEIVKRIKKECKNFPIIFRFDGDEYMEGGITLTESKKIAKKIEAAGVDAVDISAGQYDSIDWIIQPMYYPRGVLVPLAEGIKKVVNIPVITVGRISDPVLAEQIIREGKADLVALGRVLLADSEWPKKAAEGRFKDIRKCIAENDGCMRVLSPDKDFTCSVNPAVGRETEFLMTKADKPKRVLVIGGGAGGMEAARMAALRGHEVILYERRQELGGVLIEASVPAFKKELKEIVEYLSAQVKKSGVKIELGKEVTPEIVTDVIKPDVTIVAVGARPFIPSIPGIDSPKVITAIEVLQGKEVSDKVLVAGGGSVGCEVALFLAESGKDVTIVEMRPELATDMDMCSKPALMRMLNERGVKFLTNMKIAEIADASVLLEDKDGKKEKISAETIVLALGMISNKELYENLKGKVSELYQVGDCVEPRKILDAIHEGANAASKI